MTIGSPLRAASSSGWRTRREASSFAEATDDKVFEAYRELIEQLASDAFDAGANVDEAGCVLVTKEALDRVARSA